MKTSQGNTARTTSIITGGNWARPGESLWSIIQKLSKLNRFTRGDLFRVIAHDRFAHRAYRKNDLRDWGAICSDKVGELIGLQPDVIAYSVPTVFSMDFPSSNEDWADSYLRFCPDCMRRSYHSAVHQLVTIRRCPWHGQALEYGVHRGRMIPYAIDSKTLGRVFQRSMKGDLGSKVDETLEPVSMRKSSQWLEQMRELATFFASFRSAHGFYGQDTCSQGNFGGASKELGTLLYAIADCPRDWDGLFYSSNHSTTSEPINYVVESYKYPGGGNGLNESCTVDGPIHLPIQAKSAAMQGPSIDELDCHSDLFEANYLESMLLARREAKSELRHTILSHYADCPRADVAQQLEKGELVDCLASRAFRILDSLLPTPQFKPEPGHSHVGLIPAREDLQQLWLPITCWFSFASLQASAGARRHDTFKWIAANLARAHAFEIFFACVRYVGANQGFPAIHCANPDSVAGFMRTSTCALSFRGRFQTPTFYWLRSESPWSLDRRLQQCLGAHK